jgi:toxin ParE1/3/4
MARIVIAASADADAAAILDDLDTRAGHLTAIKYRALFGKLYGRLADHPDSGPPRPALGPNIRIGVVSPYIVIYRHTEAAATVTALRIVHGRRRITGKLLSGIQPATGA